LFKSFQTKLVLIFVVLILSVQLVTFFAVYKATLYNVVEQIKSQLLYSTETFKRQLFDRAQSLSENASVLTADYAFKEAIAEGDYETSLSVMKNLGARIEADRVILVSMDNKVIADTSSSVRGDELFPFERMIKIAEENDEAESIVVLDGALYEFVIVPVLAPVPIAWIGIGVKIDQEMVSNIQALSPLALDISFLQLNDQQGWSVLASTLDELAFSDVAAVITLLNHQSETERSTVDGLYSVGKELPSEARFMGEDNVILVMPVVTPKSSHSVIALLQYPLGKALSPYQSLFFWLKTVSILSLIFATFVSVLIARGVTKPVRILVNAANRMEQGNYKEPVNLKRQDELGRLASTFNIMMTGIAEREEKILNQSHHDALTGLANRSYFGLILDSQIEKSKIKEEEFSVIMVGIERLQEINNTLGHHVGDHLIKLISERLKSVLKESNTLARITGHVFTLLVPQAGEAEGLSVIQKITNTFSHSFSIEDINVDVHVSIGLSLYPHHGEDGDTLIQKADVAMYGARKSVNHFAVYDVEKDTYCKNQLSLMSDLKRGLVRNEFQLYYQPKIDLDNNRITHAEALIRWQHPVNGFMPPDLFIPLAEQAGYISMLTFWVLEQAVKQCSSWKENGWLISVAVNLSVKDLLNPGLPDIILKLLNKYQLGTESLVLEITESAVMQDPDVALCVLDQLRELGFIISIDDFGTGYSSMEYLKKLSVNNLKIDKSFVMELSSSEQDKIIVRSMIQLAHNLGLKVVAEGVEDDRALNILAENKCDYAQGYFISRPLPIEEFDKWYASSLGCYKKIANQ